MARQDGAMLISSCSGNYIFKFFIFGKFVFQVFYQQFSFVLLLFSLFRIEEMMTEFVRLGEMNARTYYFDDEEIECKSTHSPL